MMESLTARSKFMDTAGWGFILWLAGFALGMLFFPFVPVRFIGLPILAVMFPVTVLVAYRRLCNKGAPLAYHVVVGVIWVAIALALDYVFLVTALDAQDYYDWDVMVYYISAFLIPVAIGLRFGGSRTGRPPGNLLESSCGGPIIGR